MYRNKGNRDSDINEHGYGFPSDRRNSSNLETENVRFVVLMGCSVEQFSAAVGHANRFAQPFRSSSLWTRPGRLLSCEFNTIREFDRRRAAIGNRKDAQTTLGTFPSPSPVQSTPSRRQ